MVSQSLLLEKKEKGRKQDRLFIERDIDTGQKRKIALLKKTSLFKGLARQQYVALSHICRERTFPQYEIIFHQGDGSDSLYLLKKGQVKIYKNEHFLSDLYAPEVFGEIGFFYGLSRQYSVISAEEITVMEINKKRLMRLITSDNLLLYSIHLNTIDEFSSHQKKYARIITGDNHFK